MVSKMPQETSSGVRRVRLSYKSSQDTLMLDNSFSVFTLKKKVENCFGLGGTPFYSCYTAPNGDFMVIDTPARLKDFLATETNGNVVEIFIKHEADNDPALKGRLNRSLAFDFETRPEEKVIPSRVYPPKSSYSGPNSNEGHPRLSPSSLGFKPQKVEQKQHETKSYIADNWLDNTVVTPWDEAPGLKNPIFSKAFSLDLPEKCESSSGRPSKNAKRVQVKFADVESHKSCDERALRCKAVYSQGGLESAFENLRVLPDLKENDDEMDMKNGGEIKGPNFAQDVILPVESLQTAGLNQTAPKTYEGSDSNNYKALKPTLALNDEITKSKAKPSGATPLPELPQKVSLNPTDAAKLKKASDLKRLFREYAFVFDASASAEEIMVFLLEQILSDVNVDLEVVRRGLQRRALNAQPFDFSGLLSEPAESDTQIKPPLQPYGELSDDSDSLDRTPFGTLSDSRWVNNSSPKNNTDVPNLKNLGEKPTFKPTPWTPRPAVSPFGRKITAKVALPQFKLGYSIKPQAHQKVVRPSLYRGFRGRLLPKACLPSHPSERYNFQMPKVRRVAMHEACPMADTNTFSEVDSLYLGKLSLETEEGLLYPL